MSLLDFDAAHAKGLDPRLRVATDNPDCFLCGRPILNPGDRLGIETEHSVRLHFHGSCAHGMQGFDLFARYWQAIRGAIIGEKETPNPARPIVHGDFM